MGMAWRLGTGLICVQAIAGRDVDVVLPSDPRALEPKLIVAGSLLASGTVSLADCPKKEVLEE